MTTSTDQTNDEWASARIARLAASFEIPDRPDLDQIRGGQPEIGPSPKPRSLPVELVAAVLVIGVIGVMFFLAGDRDAKSIDTVGDGQTDATAAVEQPFEEQAANLMKPLYAEEVRQRLYQAQLAWSDCMHTNGAVTFPTPSPSFGDGQTTPMMLSRPDAGTPEGDAFDAAWVICTPVADAVGQVSEEIRRRGL